MQSSMIFSAIAAAAVFVSGAAYAQPPGAGGFNGEAVLESPVTAPREAVINGVAWRCEGDQCAGHADRRSSVDGLVRECKKVVAVIGPVSSYKSRGRELSDGQLRACNRGAIQMQTAKN